MLWTAPGCAVPAGQRRPVGRGYKVHTRAMLVAHSHHPVVSKVWQVLLQVHTHRTVCAWLAGDETRPSKAVVTLCCAAASKVQTSGMPPAADTRAHLTVLLCLWVCRQHVAVAHAMCQGQGHPQRICSRRQLVCSAVHDTSSSARVCESCCSCGVNSLCSGQPL